MYHDLKQWVLFDARQKHFLVNVFLVPRSYFFVLLAWINKCTNTWPLFLFTLSLISWTQKQITETNWSNFTDLEILLWHRVKVYKLCHYSFQILYDSSRHVAGKYSQCGEKWRLAVKSLILLTFPISGKFFFFYHWKTQSAYASLNRQVEKN